MFFTVSVTQPASAVSGTFVSEMFPSSGLPESPG